MIREQLAIATVAFAISFVAITEVLLSLMWRSGAKRAAADIEGHSEAAKFSKPRRLIARAARNPPNFRANHNAAHALTAIGD
jgi:thioredoxin-like negative regulator of GroEL